MADRLPPPPPVSVLRGIPPEIHVLPSGVMLWRVYFRADGHRGRWNRFRRFGPTGARFDHHPPPRREHARRAILYASDSGPTSLAEVFQDTRVIDRFHGAPALTAFPTTQDLRLLDLTGAWPTRAGASMAIGSGARGTARHWSRAIYAAYPEIDGLRYASSMYANQPAFALYERARAALPAAPALDYPLSEPGLAATLAAVAIRLGYGLV